MEVLEGWNYIAFRSSANLIWEIDIFLSRVVLSFSTLNLLGLGQFLSVVLRGFQE